MDDKQKNNVGSGVAQNFLSYLSLIFITLKLTKLIDWNWFEVLAPLLIPLALELAVILVRSVAYLIFKRNIKLKKNI